jgi:Fe-S cluster assembly scaffold protein SufB
MNKIEVIKKDKVLNDYGNDAEILIDNDNITIALHSHKPLMLINNVYKNIFVKIDDNIDVTILEIKDNNANEHFNYQYLLGDHSKVTINKFYYAASYEENIDINLNGYEAEVLLNLSTMVKDHQQYNITINHNNQKTISNIYNHGVAFSDGILDLVVNGIVKKGMNDSLLNQDNKIMIVDNGKGTIKPNLYIDDDMVVAKHGASIGRFNDNELFYLALRGIPEREGYNLLMKGFLLGNFKLNDELHDKLNKVIEKYDK